MIPLRSSAFRGALIIATAALGLGACEPMTEARVKAYLMENPERLEVIAREVQIEAQARALAEAEARIPAVREALEHDPRDHVANPGGSITVVEFFDYQCGYCKRAMPALMDMIESNPDVRFVFKEFPILSNEARVAAAVALAAKSEGQYLMVHQKLYASPTLDGQQINRILVEEGLDPAAMAEVASSAAVADHLADIRELATTIGFGNATPTFIVDGKIVLGANMEALTAAIAAARARG